ncbi:MAG: hypothetical protein SO188_07420 [Prevotella sp.]|nr:hypothetical protein [Prevotella sp.]
MDKVVVEYRYVDASYGVYGNLLVCMVVAIVAFFIPALWFFIALDVLVVIPIQYHDEKKQQKKFRDGIPALVIDGNILAYDGKEIDLSQMCKAKFHPDIDYDGNILIYRKGKLWPSMEIYTDNMLIDKNVLLELIKERIGNPV